MSDPAKARGAGQDTTGQDTADQDTAGLSTRLIGVGGTAHEHREAPMKPDLERFLTDRIDEIITEVIAEITTRVPAYTHLRADDISNLVREAVPVYAGAREASAVLPVFRAVGASEARVGHDVHQLESALRTGARVLIRRTANAAALLYPPNAEFVTVMETAFSAEGEIVGAAVEGHLRAGPLRVFSPN